MSHSNDLFYMPWPDPYHRITVHTYICSEKVIPHAHDYYELVFISEGSAVHYYQDKSTVLIPGDCFIIPPHATHSFDIFSKTVKYNCLFYPDAFGTDWSTTFATEGIIDLLEGTKDSTGTFIHLSPTQKKYFEELLNKLCSEIHADLSHADFMLRTCMMQLLCELVRARENLCMHQSSYLTQRELLPSVLEYIEHNYTQPLTTHELAHITHLSESYFRTVFKKYVGMSPIAFINKLRIDHAHFLITHKGYSVTQAAETVGISDSNYFSRLYKKILGHSPTEHNKK